MSSLPSSVAPVKLYHPPTPLPFSPADFRELDARLCAEGYESGPPAHISPADLAADVECAGAIECDFCGATGGAFAAYTKGANYVAVAICPVCGAVTPI